MIADRRLCLDRSQSRLVEAGSVDSAFLLAGKGQEIPAETVKALGLVRWSDGRVMQGPEPVKVSTANLPPEVEPEVGTGDEAPEMSVSAPPPAQASIMPPQSRRTRRRSK